MRTTSLQKLAEMQGQPSLVRNICILAHVDHGKTTLADALLASNGIISQRMAGKLRYLDSRPDEQTRGITMKSSAISLCYESGEKEYLINLIDSPGHVDFSSEVSTAVRLCDGAVVIVDVVEGVCPQTHAVLRQAWLENIKPILVLNKMDRLITELKMEPLEAFLHMQQILEQVNLVTSELFTADMMSMQSTDSTAENGTDSQNYDWTEDADEQEHKNIYFSPDQGNVVFACALDGWGFTIGQFAEIFSKKLGMNERGLRKTLWGDFYLNSKTKRIMKGAQGKGKKPMFVQFILENIWSVHEAVIVQRDRSMMEKIISSLGLCINSRDLRSTDPRVQLQAIMSQWLPVSGAVLRIVVEQLPSPVHVSEEKVEKLMCNQARRFDSLPSETQQLKQAFLACDSSEDAPVIVFVSKMVPVEKTALPQNKQRPLTEAELQARREQARARHAARMAGTEDTTVTSAESLQDTQGCEPLSDARKAEDEASNGSDSDHVFVAFARVYSGTVRPGQKLYVLSPKHDPARALQKTVHGMCFMDRRILYQLQDGSQPEPAHSLEELVSSEHMTVVTVTDLYLFMGRELEALSSVPAGNVLGLGGLEDHILKSATISSTVACPAFTDLYFDASPILRVALEPTHAGDMSRLVKGLKLLNQADPCVQVLVQETGEHVIITAGEVHLRRCLDDLMERYSKIEVTASSPIVPFRETIVPPPTVDMVNESIQDQAQVARKDKVDDDDDEIVGEGTVQIYTPAKNCMVQIQAQPLPMEVTNFLEEKQFLIKTIDQFMVSKLSEKSKGKFMQESKLKQSTQEAIKEFKDKLESLFEEAGKEWIGCVEKIWAFGPKRVGPNLLLNKVEGYNRMSIWACLDQDMKDYKSLMREYDYSVVTGFQMATLVGPLCDEPMRGVCFIVEKWEIGTGLDTLQNVENGMNETHEQCSDVGLQLSKLSTEDDPAACKGQSAASTDSECICDRDHESEGHSETSLSNTGDRTVDLENTEHELGSKPNQESVSTFDVSDNDSDRGSVSGRRMEVQGHVSGQLISIMKEACRKSFQTRPQRLMAAMYKCTIQATTDVLGKLYAVIGKRSGKILSDAMREGTQIYNVVAAIPVVECFGFAEDIRKRTSGLANPQLVFSHWEVIDVDPFWVPTTEEEIMHYGEKADSENRARLYMNTIRERKGLKVDKKIVEHAEKQRTLTRNK